MEKVLYLSHASGWCAGDSASAESKTSPDHRPRVFDRLVDRDRPLPWLEGSANVV